MPDGFDEIATLLIIVGDEVREDFAICLTIRLYSCIFEVFLDSCVVLDDAIVDEVDLAIVRVVWMCIALSDAPMCRPPGMPKSYMGILCSREACPEMCYFADGT